MENNNKKSNNIVKYIMVIIITALITCILTTVGIYKYCMAMKKSVENNSIGKQNTKNTLIEDVFYKAINNMVSVIAYSNGDSRVPPIDTKFYEIKSKLSQIYIGDIDETKMIEGALEGYVSALGDQYTEYLTEDEVKSLIMDVKGSYVGVGLYLAQNSQTNEIVVIGVVEDSPADKAGVMVGDIIKKIDNVEYTGEQITKASNTMKGKEDTQIEFTIERDKKEIELNMKRENIKFKYVKSEILENNIGYIKITSFDGGCAEDFKNAYNDLNSKGIKSLIIDLRNNGGGLVDQSLDIAEMIVPEGSKMLITKDKRNNEDISISKEKPIVNVPIVILVNEGTASASEILTAAIRENTNAKVVGTKTYGKGIIQGIFLFDDKKTGMKITMQEYFTPNYNKLHKIGITPDEIVELPDEWKGYVIVDRKNDNQLKRAIELAK